ncbi:hypothetical protein HYV71_04330 [Candidatus Uhrbacteria bacterium]|nr:hypothetical protein [Candidatus Uhrbacteria bacterium]
MQTKNVLLVVVLLGLAALAVMLIVSQTQQTGQEELTPSEETQGFVPGEAQLGFPPADTETVPQDVTIDTSAQAEDGGGTFIENEVLQPPAELKPQEDAVPSEAISSETQVVQTETIEMTNIGFVPQSMIIPAGTTVTFKNVGTNPIWPASAMHPTHAVYPSKGGCIGSTFDACIGVNPGDTWSFTFYENGSWKYHDHLNPGMTGQIIVE